MRLKTDLKLGPKCLIVRPSNLRPGQRRPWSGVPHIGPERRRLIDRI